MCTVQYDVYSNSPFSKYLVSLMCTLFYIRVHAVKVDLTEQNEQYFIGQSIVTSNEWYASLGTKTVNETLLYTMLDNRRCLINCNSQSYCYTAIDCSRCVMSQFDIGDKNDGTSDELATLS
jgi:hypothetical protein